VSEQLSLLPEYLTAHIQLTLLALLFSTAVSLPLGIAVTRARWLEQPALGLAGVIQTVPSLALLAIMVPILAGLELPSIGFLPAIIGLTLYGIFPILRNTVTGISGVDPAVKEAARGVGMTSWQQLVRVELPLAMPVIVAGIRTATVWIVGVATLSTPVGATSLGNYIFSGLQTRNYAAILVGCVAAAGLALVLDALVRAAETGVRKRKRRRLALAVVSIGLVYTFAAVSLVAPLLRSRERPIVIGAKTFTEQYILSAILSDWIEQETGRSTTLMQSLGSMVVFNALDAGDIDLYVEYSGTLWVNEMERTDAPVSPEQALTEVEQFLDERYGVKLVARLGFENAYALAVRETDARELDLHRISDLKRHAPSLVMGGDYEFFARPEWQAIRDAYGLEFADLRTMDSTFMYQAAAQQNVDVISAFSSDGRVAAYDLVVLDDDRGAIPPYDAVVLVSRRLSEEAPAIVDALSRLNDRITVEQMRGMNLAVDETGEAPSTVAARFIRDLTP
jgi:osmoprotectant transport system permease protein